MRLLVFLSLMICLSASATEAMAQQCSYITDSDGRRIERFMVIDGKPYAVFPKDTAVRMLEDLEKKKMLEDKVSLLNKQIVEKDKIILNNELTINFMRSNQIAPVKNDSFFKSQAFSFTLGYALSTAAYGFWWWTSGR